MTDDAAASTAAARQKLTAKFAQALQQVAEGAEAVSAEVGAEVEAALHAVSACPSREYQSKGRSLLFNLQKNSDLRKAVLDRDFPADKLVTASSKDLAPAALKMRRKQSAERFIATRQLSSDEKVVGWNAGTSGKLERSHKYEDGEAQRKPSAQAAEAATHIRMVGLDVIEESAAAGQTSVYEGGKLVYDGATGEHVEGDDAAAQEGTAMEEDGEAAQEATPMAEEEAEEEEGGASTSAAAAEAAAVAAAVEQGWSDEESADDAGQTKSGPAGAGEAEPPVVPSPPRRPSPPPQARMAVDVPPPPARAASGASSSPSGGGGAGSPGGGGARALPDCVRPGSLTEVARGLGVELGDDLGAARVDAAMRRVRVIAGECVRASTGATG